LAPLLSLMALDRVWVHPTHALQRIFTHATSTARVASDHLPVVADIVAADHTMTLGNMVAGPRQSWAPALLT
jgi:hypothetical protein